MDIRSKSVRLIKDFPDPSIRKDFQKKSLNANLFNSKI